MATFESDLGKVTAYAYAVDAGYQGTEAEFEEDLLTAVSTFETDKTLAVEDKAADAKATGDEITGLKGTLINITEAQDIFSAPDVSGDFSVVNNLDGSITLNGTLSENYVIWRTTLKPGKYTAKIQKVSGSTTASTVGFRYGTGSTTSWAAMGYEKTEVFDEETVAFMRANVGTYTNLCIKAEVCQDTAIDKTARGSVSDIETNVTALNVAVSGLENEASNLDGQTNSLRNAIGETRVIATELNYFSGSDLSTDMNNNARGRTGIFKLYAPVLLQFSKSGYQFRIYKQTFTDGVQTTTDMIGYWAAAKPYLISDVDFDAQYRIMIRNNDASSLRNEDFSELYFTVTADFQNVTPYIKEEIAIVDALLKAKTENTIVIALSTDNHYNDSDGKDYKQALMAKNIASLATKVGSDFMVNLGDIIEGYDDRLTPATYHFPYVNQKRLADIVNAFATAAIPLIYSIGHHEMYPIADTYDGAMRTENRGFTMAEVRRAVFGVNETSYQKGFRLGLNDVCVDDDPISSQSFYFDYTKGSGTIRFIVVDGCDYSNRGYSSETITFVTNALTDAKQNDLPVIMMCHIPPISAGVISGTSSKAKNEDEYNTAIDGVGANIIAYFYGHVHHDNIIPAGALKPYPLIGFDGMKLYRQWSTPPDIAYGNPTCPTRAINTYTEYAFDFVTIDTMTYEINCYRFGAGDTGVYPTREIARI